MNQSVRFWDRIAERYSKQPIGDEAAYQKKVQITRDYFRPDMQVLEFGCGTGLTAISHAPFVKHIEAIDISPKMIEIAQGKAEMNTIENVTFRCSSIDAITLPDQSLDAVLGLSILHLLDNRGEVINKVYNMLKLGGVFISNTACLGDSWMKYLKLIVPIGRFFGLMPLVTVFSTKALKTSLTHAGFEIDYQWQPGKNKALFIVAKKVA